jgi:DNA helicase IV
VRLPTEQQLMQDQREAIDAPLAESMMVMGPPGSGKTVVAIFRAYKSSVIDPRRPVSAITFSALLAHYMKAGTDSKGNAIADARTYNSWLHRYWTACTGAAPPTIDENSWELDFRQMIELAAEAASPENKGWNWGHLIIDEAQDLPLRFFELLEIIRVKHESLRPKERPVLTVLLDDNQTTRFIRKPRAGTDPSDVVSVARLQEDFDLKPYQLRTNHRNTSQVARFSSSFYVGTKSGIAVPSDRSGSLPALRTYATVDQLAQYAFRLASTRSCSVGIFCDLADEVTKIWSRLNALVLASGSRNKVRVQSFLSKYRKHVDKIQFDPAGGSVTVMCRDSAKGLEFDVAVVCGLDSMAETRLHDDDAKMSLYVLVTRARQDVLVAWRGEADGFQRRCGHRFPALDGKIWTNGGAM